jgi:hypothetical protein
VCVGVLGELGGDLVVRHSDLLDQAGQGRGQGLGDVAVRRGGRSGGSPGSCGQPGVKNCGLYPAGVADGLQPGAQPLGREPVGAGLAVEAGEELQADREVDLADSPTAPGTVLSR